MALTQLAIVSNRWRDKVVLSGSVSTVALDAAVAEQFQLPVGFGQCLVDSLLVQLDTFSGAYVAPAPADDGPNVYVYDPNANALLDFMFTKHWTNGYTQTARPSLGVTHDFWTPPLIYQREVFEVSIPISAGAGVTGRVQFRVRGRRIMTA